MKLYTDLAQYWPILSAPAEYAEEAAFYWRVMQGARQARITTLLELGSGGGNNASHMKAHGPRNVAPSYDAVSPQKSQAGRCSIFTSLDIALSCVVSGLTASWAIPIAPLFTAVSL
jgi:hypothetical protein